MNLTLPGREFPNLNLGTNFIPFGVLHNILWISIDLTWISKTKYLLTFLNWNKFVSHFKPKNRLRSIQWNLFQNFLTRIQICTIFWSLQGLNLFGKIENGSKATWADFASGPLAQDRAARLVQSQCGPRTHWASCLAAYDTGWHVCWAATTARWWAGLTALGQWECGALPMIALAQQHGNEWRMGETWWGLTGEG
jgi:hypothetical protein